MRKKKKTEHILREGEKIKISKKKNEILPKSFDHLNMDNYWCSYGIYDEMYFF